jgi:hypothetical protein
MRPPCGARRPAPAPPVGAAARKTQSQLDGPGSWPLRGSSAASKSPHANRPHNAPLRRRPPLHAGEGHQYLGFAPRTVQHPDRTYIDPLALSTVPTLILSVTTCSSWYLPPTESSRDSPTAGASSARRCSRATACCGVRMGRARNNPSQGRLASMCFPEAQQPKKGKPQAAPVCAAECQRGPHAGPPAYLEALDHIASPQDQAEQRAVRPHQLDVDHLRVDAWQEGPSCMVGPCLVEGAASEPLLCFNLAMHPAAGHQYAGRGTTAAVRAGACQAVCGWCWAPPPPSTACISHTHAHVTSLLPQHPWPWLPCCPVHLAILAEERHQLLGACVLGERLDPDAVVMDRHGAGVGLGARQGQQLTSWVPWQ